MFPFIVLLLLLLLLVWLALGLWVTKLLLYPPRQPLTHTPAEYGLPFEEITFLSKDRLRLHGWWIPAAESEAAEKQRPVIILLHPFGGNRHGLSRQHQLWPLLFESTLDLLAFAKVFHQKEYNVFMFDFRSHGESARALSGGGLTEDQDVMGAVDYVFQRWVVGPVPQKPDVGVVGYGMGAVAAFAAVGREKGGTEVIRAFSGDSAGGSGFITIPPLNVKYLRFLIAIHPQSLAEMLRTGVCPPHRWLVQGLLPLINHLCQARGGFPLEAPSLMRFVREVNVTVLLVQASSKSGEIQRIYENLPGEKQLWVMEDDDCACTGEAYINHLSPILAFAARHFDN